MTRPVVSVEGMTGLVTDVVFDFCGVLLDWRPRLTLEGQYPSGVIDMVMDPGDPWGFDHYDALLDSGWSEERVLEDYGRHHGPAVAWVLRVYLERQDRAFAGMIPGMEALLEDCRARGLRLWGLTNFTTRAVSAARGMFPALGRLGDVLISSEEGILKPDPRIYRRALDRWDLDPTSTAFVDDRFENVETARRLGMTGIRFEGEPSLRRRLLGSPVV
ncbi:HAD family phosphatase [uncultured Bifidobacterium sp.]|uniref:HAD family hydrolase n=1 Tax=uncultured Bifidobacterium sp. TaxID=165187 RepID=UPI0028DC5BD9|nr:HAD family phosphatase [uncultured Bifidobacterium sp.]